MSYLGHLVTRRVVYQLSFDTALNRFVQKMSENSEKHPLKDIHSPRLHLQMSGFVSLTV